jgi:hypothetical protein
MAGTYRSEHPKPLIPWICSEFFYSWSCNLLSKPNRSIQVLDVHFKPFRLRGLIANARTSP